MNIAHFINSSGGGGAERIIIELARSQLSNCHNPIVFIKENDWIEKECKKYNIKCINLPKSITKYWKVKFLPIFAYKFNKLLKIYRADVLHTHLMGAGVKGSVLSLMFGIPHVSTIHDVYTAKENPFWLNVLKLATWLGKTKLVSVSQDIERYYRSQGRFSASALRTIYNGVDTKKFQPGYAVRDPEVITIFSAGRLDKIKNYKLLLDAAIVLKDMGLAQRWRIQIAGTGPERQNLEIYANAQQLIQDGTVEFLGQVSDIPAALETSDIFTLTSKSEGLSCSIIEAMTCGLPIVATNVGGNKELITYGINGYYTAQTATDIAVALKRFIQDDNFRNSAGDSSRRYAKAHFSLKETVRKYQMLYKEIK